MLWRGSGSSEHAHRRPLKPLRLQSRSRCRPCSHRQRQSECGAEAAFCSMSCRRLTGCRPSRAFAAAPRARAAAAASIVISSLAAAIVGALHFRPALRPRPSLHSPLPSQRSRDGRTDGGERRARQRASRAAERAASLLLLLLRARPEQAACIACF